MNPTDLLAAYLTQPARFLNVCKKMDTELYKVQRKLSNASQSTLNSFAYRTHFDAFNLVDVQPLSRFLNGSNAQSVQLVRASVLGNTKQKPADGRYWRNLIEIFVK